MDIQNWITKHKQDCVNYQNVFKKYPDNIAITEESYRKVFGKQKLRKTNQTLLSQSLPTIVIWD